MPPVGFEPTILAGKRPKTYALDSAATEIHLVEEIIRTNSSEPAGNSFRVRETLISDEVSH